MGGFARSPHTHTHTHTRAHKNTFAYLQSEGKFVERCFLSHSWISLLPLLSWGIRVLFRSWSFLLFYQMRGKGKSFNFVLLSLSFSQQIPSFSRARLALCFLENHLLIIFPLVSYFSLGRLVDERWNLVQLPFLFKVERWRGGTYQIFITAKR